MVALHEVLLKAQPTARGEKLRRDRVIADGKQRYFDAVVRREFSSDVGLSGTFCQALTSIEVRREVAVAQSKPGRATECAELVHYAPRFTAQPPAEFVVVEPSQGISNRVQIGTDGQTVQDEIIANVDNRREFAWIDDVAQGAQ